MSIKISVEWNYLGTMYLSLKDLLKSYQKCLIWAIENSAYIKKKNGPAILTICPLSPLFPGGPSGPGWPLGPGSPITPGAPTRPWCPYIKNTMI